MRRILVAAAVVVLAGCGLGGRDWVDEASEVTTCAQAQDLLIEFNQSGDRESEPGSHQFIIDTRDRLCP